MAILASAETRWIIDGSLTESDPVWRWFFDNPLAERQKDRSDSYVILPGVSTVGIKWREGELQFKARIKDLGVREYGRNVKGRVETWEKWSRGGDAAEDVKTVAIARPESWATVIKSRVERKFAFDGDSVREVDANDKKQRPVNGCNVELTMLHAEGRNFWTFGFEAFNDAGSNEKNLELTIGVVFNEGVAPPSLFSRLTPAVTHSYPSWLAAIKG